MREVVIFTGWQLTSALRYGEPVVPNWVVRMGYYVVAVYRIEEIRQRVVQADTERRVGQHLDLPHSLARRKTHVARILRQFGIEPPAKIDDVESNWVELCAWSQDRLARTPEEALGRLGEEG
tara:strand:+ start:687 stop:1052 length:366 start_codon:yes stop_codon:yes gene_type:complete